MRLRGPEPCNCPEPETPEASSTRGRLRSFRLIRPRGLDCPHRRRRFHQVVITARAGGRVVDPSGDFAQDPNCDRPGGVSWTEHGGGLWDGESTAQNRGTESRPRVPVPGWRGQDPGTHDLEHSTRRVGGSPEWPSSPARSSAAEQKPGVGVFFGAAGGQASRLDANGAREHSRAGLLGFLGCRVLS